MVTLSEDIRTQLAELDTKAGALLEIIEDEHGSLIEDQDLYDLTEMLNVLQNKITTIEENQGWI